MTTSSLRHRERPIRRLPIASLMVAVVLSAALAAGSAARYVPAFTLEQITQVRTLGQFAIAPTGTRLAFGLAGHYFGFATVPRFGEENNLRMMDLPDGAIRQVTSGSRPKTSPVFSRDGRRLAYESEGDLWIVDLESGSVHRVTTNGAVDRSASWSPDGKSLVFISARGGRNGIWITSAAGEEAGVRPLPVDGLIVDDPQWSPDGKTIAFVGRRADEFYSQGIWQLPASGGAAGRLTPADRFDHSTPRWAPDGRRLAFLSDRRGYMHVYVMAPDGSDAHDFDTGPYDATAPYWTVQPVWSPDGQHLLVSVNHEGRFELVDLDVREGRARTIGQGPGQFHEIGWTAQQAPVYAYENAWSPPDIFVGQPSASPRQMTYSSHILFRQDHTATSQPVSFPSLDGLTIHGRLLTPAPLASGDRRPALVFLHPNGYGQFYDHWAPFYQYVAQSGYVVLLLDHRGSAGYGRAFREAQIGGWATTVFDDVKAAAAYVRALPSVDPARVGLLGMSFGAYEALLAYTKTPTLFQAIVDIAGNSDRRDVPGDKYHELQFGVTGAAAAEFYRKASPITSVPDAVAPLLIIQGDADRNVAPEQTYRLVHELDRLHKRYELFMYPGEPHALNEPAHQLDSYRQIMRFFDLHLRRW